MKQLVNEHHISYYRQGNRNGDTLLFIHGITTYSFIWRKLLPILEGEYDIIAIDLLGCGESDMPLDVSYSIKEHANRLHAFVQQVGIENFHLIGHDLGGGIAQIFAVNHEPLLKSLTLMNSVGYDFWPVQPITALRTPVIRQLLMGAMDMGMLKFVVKAGVFHKALVTDELMDLFWKPLRNRAGRKAFMHFARCLDAHDLTDIEVLLSKLTLPTLLMRGDADPFLGAVIVERLHQDIQHSQLYRIDSASHFIMEDEPEWVAKHIDAFICGRDV